MPDQLPLFAPRDRSDPWTVRISARARRLSVRIYPGGKVEITVPPRVRPDLVQRFIGQHRAWIERRVTEWRAVEAPRPERPDHLKVPGIGGSWPIIYRATAATTRARLVEQTLEVHGNVDDLRSVARALERWLREQVRSVMETQARALARDSGFTFGELRIRRQRTRWGSCSAKGALSLNVCLAFLDPAVVRYLLVHELCHTRHMNHSQRFWALVERHEPEWRRLDRELMQGWRRVPAWILL